MGMHLHGRCLQMLVADDGAGIFGKIAESAHLFDPHEASTPLAKFDGMDVSASLKPQALKTLVRMAIALDSSRTPNDVYFKYFEASDVGDAAPGEAFHTTEIPVRLAQLSSELVSRSQAKWVMNRATQFKTVILDFEGVVHVGQAFVDEVFRVYALAHPQIRIQTMGMTTDVAKLVGMFGGGGYLSLPASPS